MKPWQSFLAIAVLGLHAATPASLAGDHVVAWGNDINGQTSVPAGLKNAVAIAAGFYHNLALAADGTVIAWGWNLYGQGSVPPSLKNAVARRTFQRI